MTRVAYPALGVLLAGYILGLVTHVHGQMWSFINDWGTDGLELVAGGFCLARGLAKGRLRWASVAVGSGLLAFGAGDTLWNIETLGGAATPPIPSAADAFYLAFYPLVFVGMILLMRIEAKRLPLATHLDGVVAGLGAAAVTATFAFDPILHAIGGSPAEVATNLAYPIGDLILLALVVGALAMLPTWRNPRWLIFGLGCGILAVGDTTYLLQTSAGTYRTGTLLDATWPVAIFVTSLAVWLRSSASAGSATETIPRFALPIAATACSLVVLFRSIFTHESRVGLILALATLLAVVARSLLSLRQLRSVTESRRLLALTDELTGLGNRRHLLLTLQDFFEETALVDQDRRLALLLIDLDHFKEINDSFGHPVGDEVLKILGSRLKGVLRGFDVLARLGGDEFGIVLKDSDVDYSEAVAKRVLTRLEEPFVLGVASLHVGASIGIALVPEHAQGSDELLRCADVAMYRAKLARRPFDVYQALSDDGRARLRRIEELRQAIAENALTLYFQPQFDLRTGEITSAEALLRWPHRELGVILPGEFIPLAEEAGLMRPLAEWVLEAALAQCARWRKDGLEISVSVNLSATNLLDTELPDQIRFLLARHRLGPESLILEITETTLMSDRTRSRQVVQQLHDLGLTVSVDDFGTGFSSLAYLGDLAVRELKIDRLLVNKLESDDPQKGEALVQTAIELGHALGLRVVGEGVETAATHELLASLGCDFAQGFFLCRPKPADELTLRSVKLQPSNVVDLRTAGTPRGAGRLDRDRP